MVLIDNEAMTTSASLFIIIAAGVDFMLSLLRKLNLLLDEESTSFLELSASDFSEEACRCLACNNLCKATCCSSSILDFSSSFTLINVFLSRPFLQRCFLRLTCLLKGLFFLLLFFSDFESFSLLFLLLLLEVAPMLLLVLALLIVIGLVWSDERAMQLKLN